MTPDFTIIQIYAIMSYLITYYNLNLVGKSQIFSTLLQSSKELRSASSAIVTRSFGDVTTAHSNVGRQHKLTYLPPNISGKATSAYMPHGSIAQPRLQDPVQQILSKYSTATEQSQQKNYVIFVRHGESEWNQTKQYAGQYDTPLAAEGQEDAKSAAYRLSVFFANMDINTKEVKFYSSDLSRASTTAQIIMSGLNLDPNNLVKLESLREKSVGAFTGFKKDKGMRDIVDSKDIKVAPPHMDETHPLFNAVLPSARFGESHYDVVERMNDFIAGEMKPNLLVGKTTVISGHSNSGSAFFDAIAGGNNRKVPFKNGVPLVCEFVELNGKQVINDVFYIDAKGRSKEHVWFDINKVDPEKFHPDFFSKKQEKSASLSI